MASLGTIYRGGSPTFDPRTGQHSTFAQPKAPANNWPTMLGAAPGSTPQLGTPTGAPSIGGGTFGAPSLSGMSTGPIIDKPAPKMGGAFGGLNDASKLAVMNGIGYGNSIINNPMMRQFHDSMGTAYDPGAVGGVSNAFNSWVNDTHYNRGGAMASYDPYSGALVDASSGQRQTSFFDPASVGAAPSAEAQQHYWTQMLPAWQSKGAKTWQDARDMQMAALGGTAPAAGSGSGAPAGGTPAGALPGTPSTGSTSLAAIGSGPLALDVGKYLDPSMDFRIGEAMKAVENSAAARGGLQSGATLKALSDRAGQMAQTDYANAFERAAADRGFHYGVDRDDRNFSRDTMADDRNFDWTRDVFNRTFDYNAARDDRNFDYTRLSDLANMGFRGVDRSAGLEAQLAQFLGNNTMAAGGAQGAGIIGAGNSLNDTVSRLIQLFGG